MNASSADSVNSAASYSTDDASSREIKESDLRLSQLRRNADKNNGFKVKSKAMARFQGLVTYEQMMQEHTLKRMQEGIRKLLTLHSGVELSSICGCLKLKVQEKASTSIDQIIRYLGEGGEMNKDRVTMILNYMWEGALFEYLHAIGHPVHNQLPDPKKTILKLWEEGGFIDSSKSFIPHFITREIQKRYDWVQSEDITAKLEKLRQLQERCKVAETKVVAEHDYTNILTYFNQMTELRKAENQTREYLISELETSRTRLEASQDLVKTLRAQLHENELNFIAVAEDLNIKLGHSEFLVENLLQEKFQTEKELQRLLAIVHSFQNAEQQRVIVGNADNITVPQLHDANNCTKPVRDLHAQLQQYRCMRDQSDTLLRTFATSQKEYIEQLEQDLDDLKADYDELATQQERETERAEFAELQLSGCYRKIAKLETRIEASAVHSWGNAVRANAKYEQLLLRIRRIRPLLLGGLKHSHLTVTIISQAILTTLELATEEEIRVILETIEMTKQDKFSAKLRSYENSRKNKPSRMSKSPKNKSSRKSGGSSSNKKPSSNSSKKRNIKSAKSDSDVSTTGRSKASESTKKKTVASNSVKQSVKKSASSASGVSDISDSDVDNKSKRSSSSKMKK